MAQLRLYGTLTSPYVRRVRAVALELGVEVERIDTREPGGQAEMRSVNPVWRVPTAVLDGQPLFDSRVIVDTLIRRHGGGVLVPVEPEDVESLNRLNVLDGALDALINVFFMERDGASGGYVDKQRERAHACMAWLEERIEDVWLTGLRRFGVPEIALVSALGWMEFRNTYDVSRHPGLSRALRHHESRESLATTAPPVMV